MESKEMNLQIANPQVTTSRKKCLGRIARFDEARNQVWVDYDENPSGGPILAKLSRPFQSEDLKKAVEFVRYILIEFEANDLTQPLIVDIFYSVLDGKTDRLEEKEIVLAGKKLTFKASEKIVLECGDTKITLEPNRRGIDMRSENITETAANRHRIRGGHVSLN